MIFRVADFTEQPLPNTIPCYFVYSTLETRELYYTCFRTCVITCSTFTTSVIMTKIQRWVCREQFLRIVVCKLLYFQKQSLYLYSAVVTRERLSDGQQQVIRPLRRKSHVLLALAKTAHIRTSDVVGKPMAPTYCHSCSVLSDEIIEQLPRSWFMLLVGRQKSLAPATALMIQSFAFRLVSRRLIWFNSWSNQYSCMVRVWKAVG
jgi:hypothetical protein